MVPNPTAVEVDATKFVAVAEYDGTMTTGLELDGDTDADGEIDVNIGAGAASTTTIAGNLQVTTGVELGHANDTTLARSASGKVTIEGNEIITTATTEGVVRNVTVTIDQAGMNGLHSGAGQEIVANPGSGKWIMPLDCWVYVDRAGTNNNSVNLCLSWDSSTTLAQQPYFWKRFFYNEAADVFMRLTRYASDMGNINVSNKNLTLKLDGAIDADTVTSMKVYTQYMILDY